MSRELRLAVHLSAIDKATAPIRALMNSTGGLGKQIKQTRDQLKQLQGQQANIDSFKKLSAASKENTAAMVAQQQKVKALAAGMREADAPTKAMSKEFKAATREAHRLKEVHTQNSQKLQVLRNTLRDAGVSTRHAKDGTLGFGQAERDLKSRIDATNKSLTDQKNRLAAVSEQQRKLSQAKAQYERTTQLASSMTTAGAGAMAAGGGVLYGGMRMMQSGIDFDAGMSNVQSLARLDKSSPEMKALREQAKQLGAETMFTATQAAEGQGFLAMAGFTPGAILNSMPGVLDLSKAGNVELSRTADIVSNVMSAMGMDSTEMGRIGDVLASTFTSTNTSLESLGDTMKFAAPIASALGVNLETLSAMTGALGDAGIQGSMAGTGLSTIMVRIAKPTKEVLKGLDKIGISAKDAANQMKHPEMLLEQIYNKTKSLSDSERIAVLGAISGQEALKSMVTLVNKAGTQELHESIKARSEALGTSARASKAMSDNLAGDLEGLSSAFDGVKITVFEDQNEALRSLAASATETMRAINAWALENPDLVSAIIKVVAVVAALVVAGGALMLTIGSVLGPLAMMKYALTVLGIKSLGIVPAIKSIGAAVAFIGKALLANPIFIAIGLLATAAYLIYENWDGIVGGLKQMWADLGRWWGEQSTALAASWEVITEKISAAWGAVAEFFKDTWSNLAASFVGGIAGLGQSILNWSPLAIFYQSFAGVMNYFGVELPGKFSEFGSMIMQGLINGIKNMGGAVKDAVVGMGNGVTGWFKDKLGIKSPSRVFMQLGDDTAEGLALGINANKGSPLKQVAAMARQVAAAGAIALGVSVTPAVADNNQQLKQNLQPVAIPEVQSQQQRILQSVQSVTPPATQDQQQQIKQNLQVAAIPAVQDQQQRILQSVQPAALPPVPAVQAQRQALPVLTQNIQQMIISAKQVLPDLTQRIIGVFSEPISAISGIQKNIVTDSPAISFDTRPPVGKRESGAPNPPAVTNNNNFYIQAAPGMDEQMLAKMVAQEVAKINRQGEIRVRSRIGDLD